MGPYSCQEPDIGQCLPMSVSQLSSSVDQDGYPHADMRQLWEPGVAGSPVTSFLNNQSPPRGRFENRWAGSCFTPGPRPSRVTKSIITIVQEGIHVRKRSPGFRVEPQLCSFLWAPQLPRSSGYSSVKQRQSHH